MSKESKDSKVMNGDEDVVIVDDNNKITDNQTTTSVSETKHKRKRSASSGDKFETIATKVPKMSKGRVVSKKTVAFIVVSQLGITSRTFLSLVSEDQKEMFALISKYVLRKHWDVCGEICVKDYYYELKERIIDDLTQQDMDNLCEICTNVLFVTLGLRYKNDDDLLNFSGWPRLQHLWSRIKTYGQFRKKFVSNTSSGLVGYAIYKML